MSVNDNSSIKKSTVLKYIIIALLSAVSVFSFGTIYEITNPGVYLGDGILGFNPISLLLLMICFFILNRFFSKETFLSKGRVIVSLIMGLLMSVAALYSTLMLYGNHTIFSSDLTVYGRIFTVFGMSLFFVPMTNELIGLADLLFSKQEAATVSKQLFYEKNGVIYFFVVWALLFLSFVPLFLYSYPINFVSDAGYEIKDYMTGTLSTHHPLLHSIMLGFFYNIGYQKNDPFAGLVCFTLIQMLILSASFAFFLKYVRDKGAKRSLRVVLFFLFLLNPVNSYFAISTIKGVLCAAFIIFALTFLMMVFDNRKPVLNSILFIITAILSCHFRNNMLYAIAVAGIVIAIIRKGIKNRLHILLLTVIVCAGFIGSNKILMKTFNAPDADSARESMSVPLMCLARVCTYHKDELDPAIYQEILSYIDEGAISNYSFTISDGVKGTANEHLLKTNKVNFFKLVAKVGLLYPGEYVEAFCGLTAGYYAPLNSPYFLTGPMKLYTVPITDDYPMYEPEYKLPVLGGLFDYLYKEKEGRLKIPLFGMFWRGAIYFWGFVFAFLYLIYKKRPANLCIILFPFIYMLTCLLGPVSYLRYIIVNITALPLAIYLMISKDISE